MTFINYAAREINCKIVYYGPGLCGKTTNLQWIYDKTNPQAKGKLISLATETDRTLFFDFLPLDLGTVRGFKTRFHLRTVPYALQFNKRDLPTALPMDEMYRQLNFKGEPTFEAVAMSGTGVFDTLKAVAKLVLTELKKK